MGKQHTYMEGGSAAAVAAWAAGGCGIHAMKPYSGTAARSRAQLQRQAGGENERGKNYNTPSPHLSSDWRDAALHTWVGAETEEEEMEGGGLGEGGSEGAAAGKGKPQRRRTSPSELRMRC